MRQCKQCEFQTAGSLTEELIAMSDHLAVHNPSPGQWAWAYHRMQRSKELGHPCDCQECKKAGFE